MRFFNANGNLIPYSPSKKENLLSVGSREWILHMLMGKAPEGAATMDVWIHSYAGSEGQTDLDDFSISEVTDDEAKLMREIAVELAK